MRTPSPWFHATRRHHECADPHAYICRACGAAWSDPNLTACASTACDDCLPGDPSGREHRETHPYDMNGWDAIYGCRAVRLLPD